MNRTGKIAISQVAGLICIFAFYNNGYSIETADKMNGEALFNSNCASCHSGGGNLVKPTMTLSKKDREKRGLKTSQDLVKYMRSPDEEMMTFDVNKLPDAEANAIAEYIIKAFR